MRNSFSAEKLGRCCNSLPWSNWLDSARFTLAWTSDGLIPNSDASTEYGALRDPAETIFSTT
jgi:hypothetical protein